MTKKSTWVIWRAYITIFFLFLCFSDLHSSTYLASYLRFAFMITTWQQLFLIFPHERAQKCLLFSRNSINSYISLVLHGFFSPTQYPAVPVPLKTIDWERVSGRFPGVSWKKLTNGWVAFQCLPDEHAVVVTVMLPSLLTLPWWNFGDQFRGERKGCAPQKVYMLFNYVCFVTCRIKGKTFKREIST